ncbi:MAG: bifunctional proline dehydrogenase/L-glutamate gamma-semialdehyde dehydrogenase, partial [Alphaproteobacteria bacterium]|nr:bifunctional proline dehydrogenase/L-glutamate gamma-semialdehyde dehydrogenase [Alphaproteobacteria bacterium]
MSFLADAPPIDPARNAIASAYRAVESARVEDLLALAALPADARARIEDRASRLVEGARGVRPGAGGLDAFLHEYSLSTREGVVLMCLAEALLRIPDADTADRLIRDKIALADWDRHVGRSDSILVNASTWGLMLTGRLIRLERGERDLGGLIGRLIARSGEP